MSSVSQKIREDGTVISRPVWRKSFSETIPSNW